MFIKRQTIVLPSVIARFEISALFKRITSFAVCAVLVLFIHIVAFCESQQSSEVFTKDELLALVTEEYKQENLNMILNLNIPLSEETIQRAKNVIEADRIERFGPYEEKLKEMGVINEARIWFSSREWYARDNSAVVRKYLTEEDIFDYALTGVADNVFCDDNGDPLFRKLNMNEKASKDCDAGIKLIQDAGVTNVYEAIRDSGMCICAINAIPLGVAAVVDDCGAVYPNMGEVELGLQDKNLSYLFAKIFINEPTCVRYFQIMEALGFDLTMKDYEFLDNAEAVKSKTGFDLGSVDTK
jgi:hypothetical protein